MPVRCRVGRDMAAEKPLVQYLNVVSSISGVYNGNRYCQGRVLIRLVSPGDFRFTAVRT